MCLFPVRGILGADVVDDTYNGGGPSPAFKCCHLVAVTVKGRQKEASADQDTKYSNSKIPFLIIAWEYSFNLTSSD